MEIITREHSITRKEEQRALVDLVTNYTRLAKRSIAVEFGNKMKPGVKYEIRLEEVVNYPEYDEKSELYATVKLLLAFKEI